MKNFNDKGEAAEPIEPGPPQEEGERAPALEGEEEDAQVRPRPAAGASQAATNTTQRLINILRTSDISAFKH